MLGELNESSFSGFTCKRSKLHDVTAGNKLNHQWVGLDFCGIKRIGIAAAAAAAEEEEEEEEEERSTSKSVVPPLCRVY
jgi:hypothetical protein